MKPLFSIVVPTLNEERFLAKLLTSLSQQTEQDFEVIIADGASEDKTVAVAKRFEKKLPALRITNTPKRGVSHQRNKGSELARGTWIISTDADTVFKSYSLAVIKQYIAKKKHNHFTSWFSVESDNPSDALLILLINSGMELALKMKRPAGYGAFMVTRQTLFKEVGGYDEKLEFGEDNDLCRRIHEQKGEMMGMIREGLITYSLRRFHKHGLGHTLQLLTRASFVLLLTKRTPARLPGYVMGGQVYSEKEQKERTSLLQNYEKTLKEFMQELMK